MNGKDLLGFEGGETFENPQSFILFLFSFNLGGPRRSCYFQLNTGKYQLMLASKMQYPKIVLS